MIPPDQIRTWTRQHGAVTYTCSTDPSLVQLDALNASFASDIVYWAKPLPLDTLRRCIDQSLNFALYYHGDDDQPNDEKAPMIGFGRLVTDYATFAYLSDVYVLPSHQGRGLARWMMRCLDEVLASWPDLRRCLLLTRDAAAARLYRETIGALDVRETSTGGLFMLERPGTTVRVLNGSGVGEVKKAGGKGEEERI